MEDYYDTESEARQVLLEVMQEEIIDILEEIIREDDRSVTPAEVRDRRLEVACTSVAQEVLNEVLSTEFVLLAEECFDDIIFGHRNYLNAIRKVNNLLQNVVQEMVEDVVFEVIGEKFSHDQCTEAADFLIDEVVRLECNNISSGVLDHYHVRVAVSQYKQMQTSAAGVLLDKALLEAFLTRYKDDKKPPDKKLSSFSTEENEKILNGVFLDVLLSQSLALHSCFPKKLPTKVWKDASSSKLQPVECVPLNWYKEKMSTSIAEDVVLTMLCDRLDESMQILADDDLKNEAVSLMTQILDE